MRFLTLVGLFVVTIITIGGCTKDALPEPEPSLCDGSTPTYEVEVRPIIESSCAYSGCHLGGAPGLYNNYDGLLSSLEDGTFRQRVIAQKDDPNVGMPPNYSPSDRPQDLTPEELNVIECWLEAGFPRE